MTNEELAAMEAKVQRGKEIKSALDALDQKAQAVREAAWFYVTGDGRCCYGATSLFVEAAFQGRETADFKPIADAFRERILANIEAQAKPLRDELAAL